MKHVLKMVGIALLLLIMMVGVAGADTAGLTITSQPANKSVAAGSTAKFTVEATTPATAISYLWQFRENANSAWAPSAQTGNKTATLSVSATNGLNGYQFRCVEGQPGINGIYESSYSVYYPEDHDPAGGQDGCARLHGNLYRSGDRNGDAYVSVAVPEGRELLMGSFGPEREQDGYAFSGSDKRPSRVSVPL